MTTRTLRGFTLVEILVAVAIFMLAMLIATSVFMVATMHQRQTAAGQALQSDIRFAMESIVRDVKYGTIDYDFYTSGSCVSNLCIFKQSKSCAVDTDCILSSLTPQGKVDILALRDVDGNRTRYRVDATQQKLLICKITISTDPLSYCDEMADKNSADYHWSAVTPDNVEMRHGDFYLYPFDDPLTPSNQSAPSSPYLSDSQPRVTFVLNTVQRYPNGGIQQFITSQTTAVSRLYSR